MPGTARSVSSTASTTTRTRSRSSSRGSSRPPGTWPTPTTARRGEVIPVYTSTGPGPMLLTAAMGNAFYDSSAFIAITGQVATNQYDSGALQEEYRHHQADFPSIAKVITKRSFAGALRRGPRQVPAQGVQARAHRPAGPGAHRRPLRPLDPHRRRRGARAGGALADAQLAHARLAGGGRAGRSRC